MKLTVSTSRRVVLMNVSILEKTWVQDFYKIYSHLLPYQLHFTSTHFTRVSPGLPPDSNLKNQFTVDNDYLPEIKGGRHMLCITV